MRWPPVRHGGPDDARNGDGLDGHDALGRQSDRIDQVGNRKQRLVALGGGDDVALRRITCQIAADLTGVCDRRFLGASNGSQRREARRGKRVAMDDLWRFAQVDRVVNVMRPYLEALS